MKKIKDFFIKNKKYSTTIIRIGLALVLLWFGVNQVLIPDSFLGYVPPWAMPHAEHMLHFPPIHAAHNPAYNANWFISFNGILEIIEGLLLLVGFHTRIAAGISTIHLFIISVSLGYNDIAIRDFGLTLMSLSLVFSGGGPCSFDNKLNDKKTIIEQHYL